MLDAAVVTWCPDNVVNVCKTDLTALATFVYPVVNAATLRRRAEPGRARQPDVTRRAISQDAGLFGTAIRAEDDGEQVV